MAEKAATMAKKKPKQSEIVLSCKHKGHTHKHTNSHGRTKIQSGSW